MTPHSLYLLIGLSILTALLLSNRVRADILALLALTILTLTGYLSPQQACSGFSSPAVITMLCMFFLATSLRETGVADYFGRWIVRHAAQSEIKTIVLLMFVTAGLSAFMPNLATVALMLPVAMYVARQTSIAPSRLLIPVSYASLLGGMCTLIGTQPNIISADLLRAQGFQGFRFTAFTPFGIVACILGILFVSTVGRWLLPRNPGTDRGGPGLTSLYRLHERLIKLRVPLGSMLHGKTLRSLEFGGLFGARLAGIIRKGKKQLVPGPEDILQEGDLLLVEGRISDLEDVRRFYGTLVATFEGDELIGVRGPLFFAEVQLNHPQLIGLSISQVPFLDRPDICVFEIRRQSHVITSELATYRIENGDCLLLLGSRAHLEQLCAQPELEVKQAVAAVDRMHRGNLFAIVAPADSRLVGVSLEQTRLTEIFGVSVLGIERAHEFSFKLSGQDKIQAHDVLIVKGEVERLKKIAQLSELEIVNDPNLSGQFESPDVAVLEVVLSPRSSLAGKNMREIGFRTNYGFQVLAIWRDGAPKRTRIASLPLKLGDALLLQGPRRKVSSLMRNHDFVVLSDTGSSAHRTNRAFTALIGFALLIFLSVSTIQPVEIAALTAAVFVVLSGAVTMEEVYRSIEWQIVITVAALLPIGIAVEHAGVASFLADTLVAIGPLSSPYFLLLVFFGLSSILAQALDGSVAVVMLSPVIFKTVQQMGVSPHPYMMAAALGASTAFMTSFSHKANMFVMSAGAYRQKDFLIIGSLLSLIIMGMSLFMIPFFFPF